MQITIVTGPFLPTGGGPSGAVEKLWLGLAQIFARKGHQVTIVARKWPGQPSDEISEGVRFIRTGGYKRTSSINLDLLKDLFYSTKALLMAPGSDITVINTFWLPILTPLRRRHVGKTVVNVARFPKGQMKFYGSVNRLSAVSSAVSSKIISQSPSVKHLVKVIPNPVDIELFRPATPDALPPSKTTFRVLYTGRVHPEKGLHFLIPALARLIPEFPHIELAIVGPTRIEHGGGGDSYISKLLLLAEGMKVTFEKAISDPARLAARMREADYYCYPSLADQGESFGVAPLEAMALGYAPILSNLNCFREFAVDGLNCFVFDHHSVDPIENLASTFRRAMEAPELTKKMGANAVKTSQEFSYTNVAQTYLDDWASLLKN